MALLAQRRQSEASARLNIHLVRRRSCSARAGSFSPLCRLLHGTAKSDPLLFGDRLSPARPRAFESSRLQGNTREGPDGATSARHFIALRMPSDGRPPLPHRRYAVLCARDTDRAEKRTRPMPAWPRTCWPARHSAQRGATAQRARIAGRPTPAAAPGRPPRPGGARIGRTAPGRGHPSGGSSLRKAGRSGAAPNRRARRPVRKAQSTPPPPRAFRARPAPSWFVSPPAPTPAGPSASPGHRRDGTRWPPSTGPRAPPLAATAPTRYFGDDREEHRHYHQHGQHHGQ